MNLEEARKVLWLRNYSKTMGELLNEGYLTIPRLEWAAQKAYDPRLKEAAKVILEAVGSTRSTTQPNTKQKPLEVPSQVASFPIGITMDKARTTPWPYPPYKGQTMGSLVESKQLSLKDLGYAIEHAWEEKVKQSAIALSLARLNQVIKEPVPAAGNLHVDSGSNYMGQQIYRLTFLQGIISGVILAISLTYSISLIIRSNRQPSGKTLSELLSTPNDVVLLLLGLAFIAGCIWLFFFIVDFFNKKLDKKINAYYLGQEGEERVVQLICQELDGLWHLFRNVTLPGREKNDLDIVLIGPPGVWILEVKNLSGEYRNNGESWEYRHKSKWKPARISPSKQAFHNALRFANFLAADNLKVFVNPAVVWANQYSPLHVENPSIAVWHYERLSDELGNIWQREKLSKTEREKIVQKLSKLHEHKKQPRK